MATTEPRNTGKGRKRTLRRSAHNIGLPFPNFGGGTELPTICRCYCSFGDEIEVPSTPINQEGDQPKQTQRFSFSVTHQVDMLTLFTNGSFGTSSLTYRGPSFMSDVPFEKQMYYKKLQEKQQQRWEFANGDGNSKCMNNGDNKYEEEKLLLLAEEVIFLTFGVGCLSLHTNMSENLSFETLWKKLVKKNPDFPLQYAVYHYFRSKNWIPKSGLKYGGDYVLYQLGPAFDHAAYIVHITGLPSRSKPSWTEIYAWQRVASGAGKKALLCEVIPPKNFIPARTTPSSIFEVQIKEAAIERWNPSTK